MSLLLGSELLCNIQVQGVKTEKNEKVVDALLSVITLLCHVSKFRSLNSVFILYQCGG